MPKPLLTLVVAILALPGAGLQGRAGPASPGSDTDEQAIRFGAEAEIVTVDVVVLDESGDPVEGLTPDDFTVIDEGTPRPLSRFEAVTLPESPATRDHEVPLASSNVSAGGPALRTFVVVFDDVHLARDTALAAKRAVLRRGAAPR